MTGEVRFNDYTPNSNGDRYDTRVIDPPEVEILADDVEEALRARLPLITNPRKANYLANRACGFSVREACNLSGVNQGTVMKWRREDQDFAQWESKSLTFLQHELVDDILRAEFLRNMRLALNRDFKVLYKAVYNFAGLDNREFDYLKLIRKHYTPSDLLALERAMQPDEGRASGGVSVTVNVSGQQVDSEDARRAAARDLLSRFDANSRLIGSGEEPFLEAEYTVTDEPIVESDEPVVETSDAPTDA